MLLASIVGMTAAHLLVCPSVSPSLCIAVLASPPASLYCYTSVSSSASVLRQASNICSPLSTRPCNRLTLLVAIWPEQLLAASVTVGLNFGGLFALAPVIVGYEQLWAPLTQ